MSPNSRIACLAIAASTLLAAGAANGQAPIYPISGNLRLERDGVPIPFTATPPPHGRVFATPAAFVVQLSGADPRPMAFAASVLTAPQMLVQLPLFLVNTAVFDRTSSVAVQWPAAPATLSAGGRTGPAVMTHNVPSGFLRYNRTLAQFGGPAIARITGQAQVRTRFMGTPPCNLATGSCVAGVLPVTPPTSFAVGGPFGFTGMAGGIAAPNILRVGAAANGLVTATSPIGTSPNFSDAATSHGGPWTTGRVTVFVTANPPGPIAYITTGSDNRVNGMGSISLVAGGLVNRALNSPGAERGWLNLTVPEPHALAGTAAALGTLGALRGLSLVRRRKRDL